MPSFLDLGTTDLDAAEVFYSGLFGWESQRQPTGEGMVYSMQSIGGKSVAGIYPQLPDQREAGYPPHWLTYITVDDVDVVTSNVESAGGKVFDAPFDVMEVGRMSIIADPTGAVVALWQSKLHIGSQLSQENGAFSWTELITTEPKKAEEFFVELLGLSAVPMPNAPMDYTLLMVGEAPAGGIMQRPDEMGEVPAHWMNYFQVEDCEASAAKAKSLGGTIVMAPYDTGGPGTVAVIQDPQGGTFSIIQPNPEFNPFG